MEKSYVQTLMEVEKLFGPINDHDYRLYRAVWGDGVKRLCLANRVGFRHQMTPYVTWP